MGPARRGASATSALVMALVGALGLAACGGHPTSALSTASNPRRSTTTLPPTTTTESIGSQALASWVQDQMMFYQLAAQFPISWNNPDLTQVDAPPLLYTLRSNLLALKEQGLVGPATYRVWPVKVLSVSASKVVVEGCSYDSGVLMHATDKAAAGAIGQPGFTVYRATMVPNSTDPGTWLIADQAPSPTTNREGPCKGLSA